MASPRPPSWNPSAPVSRPTSCINLGSARGSRVASSGMRSLSPALQVMQRSLTGATVPHLPLSDSMREQAASSYVPFSPRLGVRDVAGTAHAPRGLARQHSEPQTGSIAVTPRVSPSTYRRSQSQEHVSAKELPAPTRNVVQGCSRVGGFMPSLPLQQPEHPPPLSEHALPQAPSSAREYIRPVADHLPRSPLSARGTSSSSWKDTACASPVAVQTEAKPVESNSTDARGPKPPASTKTERSSKAERPRSFCRERERQPEPVHAFVINAPKLDFPTKNPYDALDALDELVQALHDDRKASKPEDKPLWDASSWTTTTGQRTETEPSPPDKVERPAESAPAASAASHKCGIAGIACGIAGIAQSLPDIHDQPSVANVSKIVGYLDDDDDSFSGYSLFESSSGGDQSMVSLPSSVGVYCSRSASLVSVHLAGSAERPAPAIDLDASLIFLDSAREPTSQAAKPRVRFACHIKDKTPQPPRRRPPKGCGPSFRPLGCTGAFGGA